MGLIITACDSGPKPVDIQGLKNYTDAALKFSIEYPENWQATVTQGQRIMVFSSNDAKARFISYASEGFPGAMIDLFTTKIDSTKTEADLIKNAKRFEDQYYKQTDFTIDGIKGKKLDYGFPLEDGEFKGIFIIASKDQITYTTLKLEAFGNSWEKYEPDFTKIISSVKLAMTQSNAPDTINVTEELPFPSEKLVIQKGNGFTISIPENFYSGKLSKSGGEMIAAYNYIGDRRGDCNVQIDVIDASKTKDLKKAATELASKYSNASALSSTNVGGIDGYVINYKPTKDVKGKVYFAKKGNKLFRITINWFVPEESSYLPIFEKSFASIKFE
jgi:hypothetical protein